METPIQNRRDLYNMALIYLTLAHGADQDLDDVEIMTITERLGSWQSHDISQGTVLSAIKEALEDYMQSDINQRIDQAINDLGEHLSLQQRKLILEDLMEVAKADNRVVAEEADFLGEIAAAWDMHPENTEDHSLWSILGTSDGSDWTPIHDLALVYLTLAHDTDDTLSSSEIEAILDKLSEWLPDANEADLMGILRQALSTYAQPTDDELGRFARAIYAVKQVVPEHQHAALVADLEYIANADGVLLDKEKRLITALREAWEIAAT